MCVCVCVCVRACVSVYVSAYVLKNIVLACHVGVSHVSCNTRDMYTLRGLYRHAHVPTAACILYACILSSKTF